MLFGCSCIELVKIYVIIVIFVVFGESDGVKIWKGIEEGFEILFIVYFGFFY